MKHTGLYFFTGFLLRPDLRGSSAGVSAGSGILEQAKTGLQVWSSLELIWLISDADFCFIPCCLNSLMSSRANVLLRFAAVTVASWINSIFGGSLILYLNKNIFNSSKNKELNLALKHDKNLDLPYERAFEMRYTTSTFLFCGETLFVWHNWNKSSNLPILITLIVKALIWNMENRCVGQSTSAGQLESAVGNVNVNSVKYKCIRCICELNRFGRKRNYPPLFVLRRDEILL